jgi:hypothetical protein
MLSESQLAIRERTNFLSQGSKKVYILLTSTGTVLNKAIQKYTGEPYNHASIAFDKDLKDLYSFGRKTPNNPLIGTFVKEDIRSGVYQKMVNTTFSLYSIEVTHDQYNRLREIVSDFERRKDQLRYNFVGLFGVMVNRPISRDDAYFCSEFVAKLFEMADIRIFGKNPSLVKPYDFAKSGKFKFEFRGKLSNYSPRR